MSEKHALICDRCGTEHELPCAYRSPVHIPRGWTEDDANDYCPDCTAEMVREEEERRDEEIKAEIDAIAGAYR